MELSIQESRNLHWPWPLQNKPDAILPDLWMPKYSGFELCRTLKSLSSTQLIHVLVISGEAGANTTQFCRDLGAVAYFEEPADFYALWVQLADLLKTRRKKRRSEVRVRRRFTLRLTGTDGDGQPLGIHTTTEDVSRSAFLYACAVAISPCSTVNVYPAGARDKRVGKGQMIRSEWNDTPFPRYACRLREHVGHRLLE